MIKGEKSVSSSKESSLPETYTFSDVVDKACEGLKDRQVKYSIRRIQEMEAVLSALEQELDDFLIQKERKKG
jgi:hypothetical protein